MHGHTGNPGHALRILHVVLAPRLSGAEVIATDVAIHQQTHGHVAMLASLLPAHDDFAALAARLDAHGVQRLFPAHARRAPGRLWHLFRALRAARPDVVFAHATIPSFYARALPVGVPVVYVMHSATNDFESGAFRRVERMLARRARAVVGVSDGNVREYVAAVGAHPLMAVIPNGVDTARFAYRPVAADPRARIVQIGRYTAVKDQLQTVRAFAQVAAQRPDARLHLCGVIEDPAYFAAVRALIDTLGIAHAVELDGPRTDIPELLAGARAFTMPSRFESQGIAFVEALATGVPVVASTVPAFRFARALPGVRLVDTADTGAYAAALLAALDTPRARRALVGLTVDDTAARYIALAHRIVVPPPMLRTASG